jgi:hypothetical protein
MRCTCCVCLPSFLSLSFSSLLHVVSSGYYSYSLSTAVCHHSMQLISPRVCVCVCVCLCACARDLMQVPSVLRTEAGVPRIPVLTANQGPAPQTLTSFTAKLRFMCCVVLTKLLSLLSMLWRRKVPQALLSLTPPPVPLTVLLLSMLLVFRPCLHIWFPSIQKQAARLAVAFCPFSPATLVCCVRTLSVYVSQCAGHHALRVP